jgi:long-chain fatty acid transport protein
MQCKSLRFALAALLAAPVAVFATNGYFPIGFGLKTQAMGGAGIAYPQDANAAGANPAGMAMVPQQFNIAMAAFIPPRTVGAEFGEFQFQTPEKLVPAETISSEHNAFPFPGLGISFEIGDRAVVGMTVVGAGANTDYKRNFFALTGSTQTSEPLGVQYFQMQMLPTFAYRITDNQSLGASLAVGVQTFRAYGLGNFAEPDFQFSADPENLTNNGPDWSYGAGLRFGWLGNFFEDRFSMGAYWATKVYMSRFNRYSGLFADNGSFDIPEHFGVGFAMKPTDNFAVALDVQRIRYNDIPAIGSRHTTLSIQDPCSKPIDFAGPCTTPGAVPVTSDQALGGPNSWGFGWEDQTVYKIGAKYQLNKQWSFRAGWNYGKSPIPDDQLLFSLLAPAVTENHATLGFSYAIARAADIDFYVEHALKHAQVCAVSDGCTTFLTTASQPDAYVAAELEIWVIGGGLSFKF